MNEVDDSILEFYAALDSGLGDSVELKAGEIYRNLVEVQGRIDKSHDTIARRMRRLATVGLLENTDDSRGYYRLTDLGQRYLCGDLTDTEEKALRRAYEELIRSDGSM